MRFTQTDASLVLILQAINCVFVISQLSVSDSCKTDANRRGICASFDKCPPAIKMVQNRTKPKLCGFEGKIPTVCCEYSLIINVSTAASASIAAQKCLEYQAIFADDSKLTGIGGTDALDLEFPHMAILGYSSGNDIKWLCGGSLISKNFVLTAAHCIITKYGNVSIIRLGVHQLSNITDRIETLTVKMTYQHPEYVWSQNYHDIALIELNRPAKFQSGVTPACLQTARQLSSDSFTATGWGATELYGDITDILQKVNLEFVPYSRCVGYYKNQKTLAKGLSDELQFCADGGKERADTCQGDSGGPLHLPRFGTTLHTVAGITSFGLKCAVVPAVYTRVSYYVPWIENIVWPTESLIT